MPEITLLGWIHTIIAIIAVITGFYTLAAYKVITPEQKTGRLYLICTLIAAAETLTPKSQGPTGSDSALTLILTIKPRSDPGNG